MPAIVSGIRNFEPGAAPRPRFQQQVGIQRARPPLQTRRTQPQQFQFLQRIGAGETEAVAVIVHRDLQAASVFSIDHRHARGAGVLLHVVQRFAQHLQHFQRQSPAAVRPGCWCP